MTDATQRQEAIDRLREIQSEMEELLIEALQCIREAGGSTAQAEAYWKAHIVCAIRNDHGYLGGSMVTLQDTIEDLETGEDDDGPSPVADEDC